MDLGDAKAVAVHDERSPNERLFARICPPHAMPRLDLVSSLKHMRDAKMIRPLDWGRVNIPGSNKNFAAIVFERPKHGALMPLGTQTVPPMQTEEIAKCLMVPAAQTLGLLTQRSMSHRAIRADNIFWDGEGHNTVLLGDCVTTLPAQLQPVIYETIESAMTPPIGRGPGSIRDDFYALGVTVLTLATGKLPLIGVKDRDIISAKLSRGSYSALMDGARPPFGLRELLRGLLSDNADERWALEQLEQWIGGGLRSTVQEGRSGAAERPFEFNGKDYTNFRSLSQSFGENWEKAAKAVAESAFAKWVRRGATEGAMAERVKSILAIRGNTDKMSPVHISQISILLDPTGPLRFNGLVTMPNALGAVLADGFQKNDKDKIGLIIEAITSGTAAKWYTAQSQRDQIVDEARQKEVKRMQQLLRHTGPGYGVERCLYMLNPSYPCQSEFLDGLYIADASALMPALEALVEKSGSLPKIMDRHLVAFIASRIKANIDRLLVALEAAQGDPFLTKLGMLSLFAAVQSKHGPAELPNLCAWMAKELEPAVNRFDSKTLRDQMRKKLNALAGSGNLIELHACLNNDNALKKDEVSRKKATRDFASASKEIAALESKEFHDSVQRLGWRIATGISTSFAFVTAVFVMMS
jgi:serine/threonine protein kinase